MDFSPFVRLRSCDGRVYSAADEFLREVDTLRREILSQRVAKKGTASIDQYSGWVAATR
jgi:hypothetical protein